MFLALALLLACQPPTCSVARAVFERAPAAQSGSLPTLARGRPAEVVYRNKALGFSISYPRSRRARACRRHEQIPREENLPSRCVALTHREFGQPVTYATVELFDGSLEEIAHREAGFEPDEKGGWRTIPSIKFVSMPVDSFASPGWTGLRVVNSCSFSDDENGLHVGECLTAVISDGRRAAVVTSDHNHGRDDATLRSLMSFRFENR